MKKVAALIATLTMMSVAAQNQPGQKQSQQEQSKSGQAQSQQSESQSKPGQIGQSEPAGQGGPGQSQSTSATARQQGQQASGAAGQSQKQGQFSSTQPSNVQQYIDFKVVDQQDKQIGTVDALWEDQTGQPAFLAIKRTQGQTGQQSKAQQGQQTQQLLVVPAQRAEVNRSIRTVRVPYTQQVLQSAPTFKNEEDLDRQAQMRITAFYRQHGYRETQQQSSVGRPAQGTSERDQATIQLKEEELKVGKRQVDAGGILLKKVVRSETVNKPVELQREEIVIERVQGTGRPVEGEIGTFKEGQIYIPLRREEAVVDKDVRVKETLQVGKETQTERQTVRDQVREEQLQIIKEQGTDVQVEGQRPGQTEQERRRQQQQNRSNSRP